MRPTLAQIKEARRKILALANSYEPKKRKVLRGMYFDNVNETFRWSGQAHDYTCPLL